MTATTDIYPLRPYVHWFVVMLAAQRITGRKTRRKREQAKADIEAEDIVTNPDGL